MKKKIIITFFMAFMATNIFAFQIGGALGYGENTNWGGSINIDYIFKFGNDRK